jgi:NAD(P)-dependent dehydrogenase (short-subunit alcohol dehydrogenase family)
MNAPRSVLITGGNGGIGRALCAAFGQSGWYVIATDIQSAPQAACDEYLRADLLPLGADLPYREEFLGRVKAALPRPGALDALINNAALQIIAPIEQLSAGDWLDTCGVNVIAPFLLVQGLLQELESVNGAVVNVGSIHAKQTKPHFSAYAASKAALVGLTRSLAVELGSRVRVSAVCPAAIVTPMLAAGFAQNPEGLARLADYHPSRSIGLPEDVAGVVVMLASSVSKYVTGVIVNIDGGISSRLFDPS